MKPIRYFNRSTGQVETEAVYGGGFLRWAYLNPLGRLALHAIVKRAFFSKWYGWRMQRDSSQSKIQPFIQEYGTDVNELADDPATFRSFNDFFIRRLKPEARPINDEPKSVVFPADGRHLGFQNVSKADGVFVKGQKFNVEELVGDSELSKNYREGSLVLSRLCPVDYHRFHFPCAGTPSTPRLISGPLFSVNPIALRKQLAYMWRNKREITRLKTAAMGTVLLIEVGATCVGSIIQSFTADQPVNKGDEKGRFEFGGSSTITLFEPGRIQLDEDLIENSRQCRELYAKMGDRMGTIISE
jgi:phosphatidylserine decarboxylase